jgi:hypothetical protein
MTQGGITVAILDNRIDRSLVVAGACLLPGMGRQLAALRKR